MAVVIKASSKSRDIRQLVYELAAIRGASYTISFPSVYTDSFTFSDKVAGDQVIAILEKVFPEEFQS